MPRALVVEDGERISGLLRSQLCPLGWTVDVAKDAVAAVDLLRKMDVELVVVDLGLPGGGALEVIRGLHDNDVLAAVLLLANRDDVLAALSAADDEQWSGAR